MNNRELGKCLLEGVLIALFLGGLLILALMAAPIAHAQGLFLPLVMVGYDMPLPQPTATPMPYPGWVVLPPICPGEVAPPETFTDIGATATLMGSHDIYARVCVAGLQTLMMICFSYDGQGAGTVDVRLLKGNETVAKLATLEGPYDGSTYLRLCIPWELRDGDADRIAIVSTEEGIYAVGIFEPPPSPTPRPPPTPIGK